MKHHGLLGFTLEGTNHRKPGTKPNKALFRQYNRRMRDDEALTSRIKLNLSETAIHGKVMQTDSRILQRVANQQKKQNGLMV